MKTNKITIAIEMGNDAVQTLPDLAVLLKRLAERFREGQEPTKIMDVNGNSVGEVMYESKKENRMTLTESANNKLERLDELINEDKQSNNTTLQDYTNHEAGAVQYEDGEIWIGNWSSIYGVPRLFATGMIGLNDLENEDGELLSFEKIDVPEDVIEAMQEHERENGDEISDKSEFSAIEIPSRKIIIVIAKGWN